MTERSIVLDTHIWIWAVSGDRTLTKAAIDRIYEAQSKATVLLPAISIWEVAMLSRRKRIQLGQQIAHWASDAIEKPGFTLAPLLAEIALDAAILPAGGVPDPADSMIIATARYHNAVLITRDARIIEYANEGHVEVLVG
jgi:PIN domain nuclease of toxin-antitoxin system